MTQASDLDLVKRLREPIIADAFAIHGIQDGQLAERLIQERGQAADTIERLSKPASNGEIAEIEKRSDSLGKTWRMKEGLLPSSIVEIHKDRATLLSHIRAMQAAAQWQPIETAPKDGTFILCAHKSGHINICRWHVEIPNYEKSDAYWRARVYEGEGLWKPTHWMPLRTAPRIDAPTAAEGK